jgi:signal transduction histidine kinase
VGLETALWRSVAVFRVAALAYAAVLLGVRVDDYSRPALAWSLLAVMGVWTGFAWYAYRAPRRPKTLAGAGSVSPPPAPEHGRHRRGWLVLGADMAVTAGCLIASQAVVPPSALRAGAATVPTVWVAGVVLAWAVFGGRRFGPAGALAVGGVAAVLVGGIDVAIRGRFTQATMNGAVLLLLAGVVVGHVVRLASVAEQRLQRAAELEAATRERERLARGIHDSVLQLLALMQRRGAEIGGEAAELGRLAGEQEANLRALVAAAPPAPAAGSVDLGGLLSRYASTVVSVAAPATEVRLPGPVAEEVAAAVGSALDNVRVHCGVSARAWVLLEEEGVPLSRTVTVTVRDEGPGIPEGRLAEAEAAGRLGVAQSIRGRIRDLGGTVTITTAPGQGTEIELRVPQ